MSVLVNSIGTSASASASSEYGIFFNATNEKGFPTDAIFKTDIIPEVMFKDVEYNNKLFLHIEKLEVIANKIETQAFNNFFKSVNANSKFKIKSKSIASEAFAGISSTSLNPTKVWISKDCVTMGYRAFYNVVGDIYCEATTAPTGWDSQWTSKTVTYGISEAQFDAL